MGTVNLMKWFLSVAFVAGVMMFLTSCATTGHWEPQFPEKGSAKGGASLLMRR
jgi:hypothetical protein